MTEKRLWTAFSIFIRLRDSDENGYCKCFTCPRVYFWKEMHCGHGIGRQFKATWIDEKNNHAQCVKCNSFEEGKKDVYKEQVDKKYGKGTWDLLIIKSKGKSHLSKFEFKHLEIHYKKEAQKLINSKQMSL